ncbi:stage II sporulation protein M [soil metagenome]
MAIRQARFEADHAVEWARFERWLVSLRKKSRQDAKAAEAVADAPAALADREVPAAYRRICQQLAVARERQYSSDLVDRVSRLVLEGHQRLYGAARTRSSYGLDLIRTEFPRTVRAHARLVWLAAALLFVPLIGLIVLLQYRPEVVYLFIDASNISSMESMYDPSKHRLGMREATTNVQMFGFYISHNIQIGFQTFATGIAFGIGPVFFLLFNGLQMGAVAGHLTQAGYGAPFWSFVPGHSAFELTAIAISGAAGMKLGIALIAPGGLTRRDSLVIAGRPAVRMMFGAGVMLVVAALLEAFWSPLNLADPWPKYAVGVFNWVLVLGYLVFAGRDHGAAPGR